MPTTLQPENLLATLKYDFKVMQRENSPNEVQKWYPTDTNFIGVQTVQMGYCTPKWGTVGNPGGVDSKDTFLVITRTSQ